MNIDKNKYTEILFYILSQSYNKPHLGKTVLCTLLYFIDFNYYELYGKLLTKETYIKSKKGIKPEHFNKITEEIIGKKTAIFKKRTLFQQDTAQILSADYSQYETEREWTENNKSEYGQTDWQ